jgi:arylsulfatase A-like enzyme
MSARPSGVRPPGVPGLGAALVTVALCAFGLSFASACSRAPLPPVVALITVDTWRFDHWSAERSPALWALAERGERYTNAWSPIGLTSAAHATMLTGLPPWQHGMEANNHHGYSLKEGLPTLPEMFPGYASGAFVSAWPAGPAGGLDRGWERFDGPESGERDGEIAVQRALDWLPTDRPALLWVHVYEPHGPYVGEGETDAQRYAEEVLRADRLLEPLLERLVERGARVVVAADHGEVLTEETCGRQHERSIGEGVLHVPLLRWSPELEGHAGARDERVGLEDVPALLRGEPLVGRPYSLGESGMCEADCAPGCAPAGLIGRDRTIFGARGRWIKRPGRGTFAVGKPDPDWLPTLEALPPVRPPGEAAAEAGMKALGYLEPSAPSDEAKKSDRSPR